MPSRVPAQEPPDVQLPDGSTYRRVESGDGIMAGILIKHNPATHDTSGVPGKPCRHTTGNCFVFIPDEELSGNLSCSHCGKTFTKIKL